MLLDAQKILRIGICILLVVGVGLLVMRQTRGVLRGPGLTIDEPIDGSSSPVSAIALRGSTQHLARLMVNNYDAPAASDGTFSLPLLLSPGYNIITVDVFDRFGKHTQKMLHIYGDFPEYDVTALNSVNHQSGVLLDENDESFTDE